MTVAVNEQIMMKKQETLNLHLVTTSKLKQRFEQLCDDDLDQEVSRNELCSMLVNCKLLKADFPKRDERWVKFYRKLQVIDEADLGSVS